MKLRIRGNSIRLRLLVSEVERLSEGRGVSAHTSFPSGRRLTYTVAPVDAEAIGADLNDDEITVRIPATLAVEWAAGDEVSLAATEAVADGELSILIEKDFVCLGRKDDPDRADSFPHPDAGR